MSDTGGPDMNSGSQPNQQQNAQNGPNAPGTTGLPPPQKSGVPPNIQQLVASKRLQQAQAQVGEVVDIMRVNVEKVLERDQKLCELDRRADDLQEGASQFQQQAVRLKHKSWWENTKMWIVIGVIALVVIIAIVISTTSQTNGESMPSVDVTSSPETADNIVGGGEGGATPAPEAAGPTTPSAAAGVTARTTTLLEGKFNAPGAAAGAGGVKH